MPQTTQNNHNQDLARHVPAHHLRVDKPVFNGKQKPGQSGQGARNHKGSQFIGIGGKPSGAHALLIDAYARQRPAKFGAPQKCQKAKTANQAGQRKAVERLRVVQVQPAAQTGLDHEVNTIGATAQGRVMHHVIRHLRERQGHHNEIHALGAQRQSAYHQGIGARQKHAQGQQNQNGGRPIGRREQHGGIGADAEKRRLPEAHQAGHAHQQL